MCTSVLLTRAAPADCPGVMSRGPLLELSKRAASRGIAGCLFLAAVCAGVLALDWTFDAGWWTAPVAWVFSPALAFCLLLSFFAARERLSPQRSIVFTGLARYGDPAAIAAQVDDELRTAGADVRRGAIWLTPAWIVGLVRPGVFRLADLAGVGIGPGSPGQWRVVCWHRGERASHTFDVSQAEGERLREQVRRTRAELVVTDIDTFDARWNADRLVCEAATLACGTAAEPPAA